MSLSPEENNIASRIINYSLENLPTRKRKRKRKISPSILSLTWPTNSDKPVLFFQTWAPPIVKRQSCPHTHAKSLHIFKYNKSCLTMTNPLSSGGLLFSSLSSQCRERKHVSHAPSSNQAEESSL